MRWNGSMGATGINSNTSAQWTQDSAFLNNYLGFEGVETQTIAGLKGHRQKVDSVVQAIPQYKNYV